MARLYLIISLLFCQILWAQQEVVSPLIYNSKLAELNSMNKRQFNADVSLPFFDDFSSSGPGVMTGGNVKIGKLNCNYPTRFLP